MSSVDGSITLGKVPTTPYPLVFLRCRTIAFCAITFFSFAWVILLSIVVFMQWEFMDKSYQSTIMVMITVYAITVILLLVMLTRRFRAWLDAARFSLLLVAHIGVSAAFAHYSRRFSCPQPTVEDRNVCGVLILYILISSWLLPLLIAIYASALGVMALYRWHLARPFDAAGYFDVEKDSLDHKLNLKHKSQVSSFLVGPPPPSPTPIAARFSTQLDIPNRFATMPTPTTADFSGSSYYSVSPMHATHASPAVTPTSMGFPADSQPYLVPTPPNGSPTQLPYLMPPSPNNPAPQPYSAAPSDTQPYSTPPVIHGHTLRPSATHNHTQRLPGTRILQFPAILAFSRIWQPTATHSHTQGLPAILT
ncbi:hypothetical protein FA13DRAFT_357218 [Coprinellus micaceus]|uniref:Uncharacterized protein n=1 Tax=Coprinellus micaceus TaxID=71717 RepID=A0A4Y7TBH2_COPMI|nr:hypothetical protein FA13DRAFT_357218 [Coprinellus micaceus]